MMSKETALIIANGAACNQNLVLDLMNTDPFVIVLDSAIERVLGLNIKVNVILGDFDRNYDAYKYQQKPYSIEVVHAPDQTKTDLDKAYDYLISRNIVNVNVIWATGKRADHTITNLTNIVGYRNQLNITIIDDHSRVFLLPRSFEKWYPAKSIISLIPVGEVNVISSENLLYPLKNLTLTLGYKTGSSNSVVEDGLVKITHNKGNLLLMECFD